MSAEAVGSKMPMHLTLDDLAAMAEADEHHRYELSPEGVLFVMPPAGPEHAIIVSRMFAWLVRAGFEPEQVVADMGIDTGGARIPDLSVWASGKPPRRGRSSYATLDGMLLAVEVVSTSSKAVDRVIKREEYAAAGIPRYWIVDQDAANTVTMFELDPETGSYGGSPTTQPLAWILNTTPDQLGLAHGDHR